MTQLLNLVDIKSYLRAYINDENIIKIKDNKGNEFNLYLPNLKTFRDNFDLPEEIKVDYASHKYEQSYETPYIPNGQIIKFQLINNYYKGKNIDNHF